MFKRDTFRIAVLVSGGGTNLQALLDAQQQGMLGKGHITCVIASKEGCYALERAQKAGVEALAVPRSAYASSQAFDAALLHELRQREINIVVLAGFLCILGKEVVNAYEGRILNVHPSLIPAFCGEGFYGLRVHQAALAYGVKVTGATVHLVSEVVDGGRILLQKAVPVLPDDTPEVLQKRVMQQAEWEILPKAVALLCWELELETGKEQEGA